MSATIDVRDLRVGMFVHLDLGWMSHPFPLSSFRIASAEQIGIIRGLGVSQLRWSPDKSDTLSPLAAAGADSSGAGPAPAEAAAPEAEADTESAAQKTARAELAAQRQAQAVCERQYAEASHAWRGLAERVPNDPALARDQAHALTRALLDKMLGHQELCIRLLTEGAGDRATAHALNVTIVALLMGRCFGLSEAELMDLGQGAMLHDIGKLDVPDRLRFMDEGFTSAETTMYRDHVAHGVRHGQRMGLSPGALLVIAQHHEQADGNGFPRQLSLDRLSGGARIVALVNRYDNLCNPLSPARALTPHEALSLLFAQGKHKFDATMLNGFIRMMGVYPPGSLVQLTDDRYAMVMSVNSTRPLKPRVLVHEPRVARDEALFLDLETCADLGIRRSLKPAQLPSAALDYLAPGRRVAYFFEPSPGAPQARPGEEPAA